MDFKKILLIICLFVGLNTVAQNRLEFNQVISYDTLMSATPSGSYITMTSETLIVPAGKVWKITYLSLRIDILYWKINGVQFPSIINITSGGGTSSIPFLNNNNIWLKSGDQISGEYYYECQSCPAQEKQLFISAIEFNIVTD